MNRIDTFPGASRLRQAGSLFALILCVLSAPGQPANDNFDNRIALASTNVLVEGTTASATTEPGEPTASGGAVLERSVWYSWTAPTNGILRLSGTTGTTNFLLNIGVYFGTTATALVAAPSGAGGGFAVGAGDTLAIQVAGRYYPATGAGGGWGSFTLNLTLEGSTPPAWNDNFDNRTTLAGTNVSMEGTTHGASIEPGENMAASGASLDHSVWYSWTAPTNGIVRVWGVTTVPDFLINIGTYRGTAVNALGAAPTTPDGRVIVSTGDTIAIQVATIYYVLYGGGGGWGPFTLHLMLDLPNPTSPNDVFANRFEITAPLYHFDGSLYGATNEVGEPLPAPNLGQTLWWKFNAPEQGVLNLFLTAGQFQGRLAVYEGSQLDALTAMTPLSAARYPVQAGREYAVQLASDYVPSGDFALDARFHSPTNDSFAGSERLGGTNVNYYGNFTLATPEAGEPPSGASNTVWVSWVAPYNGSVQCGIGVASQQQFMNYYTGSSLDKLQPVPTRAIGNGISSFIASEGTAYHFQFSGGADDFILTLQLAPFAPASNDDFAEAELVTGQVITFPTRSVAGATMEPGEPQHSGPAAQKSIWWTWQAPRHGWLKVSAYSLFIPWVTLAVYQGSSVDALALVASGTNLISFSAIGGQTYHLAAVVPAEEQGEITCSAQLFGMSSTGPLLPGNILQEPSWEGTEIWGAQYWRLSGGVGGYVNERGSCDGSTWPVLTTGAQIWQDFPTEPGHDYAIQFAHRFGGDLSGCCGLSGVRVLWDDQEIGLAGIPESEPRFWHWDVFMARASNTTSRITFQNIHRPLEMDAFSVVDMSVPPSIVSQPASLSTVAGGKAGFAVGANGALPLSYQWFFNSQPLAGRTSHFLVLDRVLVENAGTYFVIVTNALGMATSAPVSLTVESPTNAVILVQPYGDTIPVGGYFNLIVVAAGVPPLAYQWFQNGQPVADATNRNLTFPKVQLTNAGLYEVLVANPLDSVWSLPARLTVASNAVGGGMIDLRNRLSSAIPKTNDAPIFDVDGTTPLSGSAYVAQLYAGPSLETIRPVADPATFMSGALAGFFSPRLIALPDVPPGGIAFAQVRVWERSYGASYEEARVLGGKFGRSEVLQATARSLPGGTPLIGLTSFNLQAGLPGFSVGVVKMVERQPRNVVLWSVQGQAGFRYVVEKYVRPHDPAWRPFLVLTNGTGTVTFTDSASSGAATVFYRARILD